MDYPTKSDHILMVCVHQWVNLLKPTAHGKTYTLIRLVCTPVRNPVILDNTVIICNYLETDVFHLFGVPNTIVSDNNSQFVSREFTALLKRYGISHVTTIYILHKQMLRKR